MPANAMTITLYYSPGSCSLAPHIVLHEIEQPFELKKFATADRANYSAEYLSSRSISSAGTAARAGRCSSGAAGAVVQVTSCIRSSMLLNRASLTDTCLALPASVGTGKPRNAKRAAVSLMILVLASLPLHAIALDREGAIEAAKRQTKEKCGSWTPCTFTAKQENNKWFVRVEFTKRTSVEEKASPGGHAIFIFDQTGKVVGRMEGK